MEREFSEYELEIRNRAINRINQYNDGAITLSELVLSCAECYFISNDAFKLELIPSEPWI